jgi:hypothetical protein
MTTQSVTPANKKTSLKLSRNSLVILGDKKPQAVRSSFNRSSLNKPSNVRRKSNPSKHLNTSRPCQLEPNANNAY